MGSWWIYAQQKITTSSQDGVHDEQSGTEKGYLKRVPNGREDVFTDTSIDLRAKRFLMKFLKFVADFEQQREIWEDWAGKPFPDFLTVQFSLPADLQAPLLALTLSPLPPNNTLTSFALWRIKRHLTSIGVFGPGFAAVIPKWGGGAEIAQVACRACAVGGGVYALGRAVDSFTSAVDPPPVEPISRHSIRLQGGEVIKADWIIGSSEDLYRSQPSNSSEVAARSITIVSSPLASLFPVQAEGAPFPGGAVVVFPTGSLTAITVDNKEVPPVYIIVHSSETGECPDGQCRCYRIHSSFLMFML